MACTGPIMRDSWRARKRRKSRWMNAAWKSRQRLSYDRRLRLNSPPREAIRRLGLEMLRRDLSDVRCESNDTILAMPMMNRLDAPHAVERVWPRTIR